MTSSRSTAQAYDVEARRAEFPVLAQDVHGHPLVYLDNAATTQRPLAVLDAMASFHRTCNANVHRGVHTLSQQATDLFEAARRTVAEAIGAAHEHEIVFTSGTTASLNLVAATAGRLRVGPERGILLTGMEHHSNIVPWQLLAEATGAPLDVVPLTDAGTLDLDALHRLLTERTAIFAFNHVSNALGTVNPVADLVRKAHAVGALAVVDGAQGIPHGTVDVQALDADFYAFSGHKVYGPMGIGVLYGKAALLQAMPPWQGGGEMIRTVSFSGSTYADPPARFEAGTPNVVGAVGLAAALTYLASIGADAIANHECSVLDYAVEQLGGTSGVRLIGTGPERAGALSFVVEGIHPHDLGTILDHRGVAIRAGHHCAQPVMERFGVPATARASVALYTTLGEIDALVESVRFAQEMFG